MPNAKLINLSAAANMLGLSLDQVRYLIRKGVLTATNKQERMVKLSDVQKAKRNRPKRGNPNWKRKDAS